jgi:hypothetical protein
MNRRRRRCQRRAPSPPNVPLPLPLPGKRQFPAPIRPIAPSRTLNFVSRAAAVTVEQSILLEIGGGRDQRLVITHSPSPPEALTAGRMLEDEGEGECIISEMNSHTTHLSPPSSDSHGSRKRLATGGGVTHEAQEELAPARLPPRKSSRPSLPP